MHKLNLKIKMPPKAKSQPHPETNEARLLAAAIRCIEKYGLKKTFIDDIAKEAGLSRPTAYRAFLNRKELLEKLAMDRFSKMETELRPHFSKYKTLEEALIKGTILSMQVARKDKTFIDILETLGDEGLERYLLHSKSPVKNNVAVLWSGVIDRAIESGELRSDLTKSDVFTWIIAMECILLLRDELNLKGQERFLKKLMVPALLAPKRK